MNAAQKSLIWREWKLAADWYLAHGKVKADLEGLRHLLIRQAVGGDLSMSKWERWTNSQVDRVLAKFRAVYDGGNLNAQLKAQEQPEERRRKMIERCHQAAYTCINKGDDAGYNNDIAQRYLDGTANKMFGVWFREIDDSQLPRLMGALEHSAVVKERKRAAEAAAKCADVNCDEPF